MSDQLDTRPPKKPRNESQSPIRSLLIDTSLIGGDVDKGKLVPLSPPNMYVGSITPNSGTPDKDIEKINIRKKDPVKKSLFSSFKNIKVDNIKS